MINLQSINISNLPFLPLAWKKALPECSGIYFVINPNNEILYIGRSNNIRSRWQQHHRYHQLKQLENIKIAWLELSDDSLLNETEALLIERFKPSFNRMVLEKNEGTTKTNSKPQNKVKTFSVNRVYIDISQWWPRDEQGNPVSVYSVYKSIEGTDNEVNRHTLTRARDGLLEKIDLTNFKALARLCSLWSGSKIIVDSLIKEDQ